jgi:hypothetical protein
MKLHFKVTFRQIYWFAAFLFSTILIGAQDCISYLTTGALVFCIAKTYCFMFLSSYVLWKAYKIFQKD